MHKGESTVDTHRRIATFFEIVWCTTCRAESFHQSHVSNCKPLLPKVSATAQITLSTGLFLLFSYCLSCCLSLLLHSQLLASSSSPCSADCALPASLCLCDQRRGFTFISPALTYFPHRCKVLTVCVHSTSLKIVENAGNASC